MNNKQSELKRQRSTLLLRLTKTLEGPMAFLGFVWLALLLVELIKRLSPALELASLVIWVIFILDFFPEVYFSTTQAFVLKEEQAHSHLAGDSGIAHWAICKGVSCSKRAAKHTARKGCGFVESRHEKLRQHHEAPGFEICCGACAGGNFCRGSRHVRF
jgi:hypothetical protein